jgi:hypothetical protein
MPCLSKQDPEALRVRKGLQLKQRKPEPTVLDKIIPVIGLVLFAAVVIFIFEKPVRYLLA